LVSPGATQPSRGHAPGEVRVLVDASQHSERSWSGRSLPGRRSSPWRRRRAKRRSWPARPRRSFRLRLRRSSRGRRGVSLRDCKESPATGSRRCAARRRHLAPWGRRTHAGNRSRSRATRRGRAR